MFNRRNWRNHLFASKTIRRRQNRSAAVDGMELLEKRELLTVLTITSNVPGSDVTVDGRQNTTPFVVDRDPGAQIHHCIWKTSVPCWAVAASLIQLPHQADGCAPARYPYCQTTGAITASQCRDDHGQIDEFASTSCGNGCRDRKLSRSAYSESTRSQSSCCVCPTFIKKMELPTPTTETSMTARRIAGSSSNPYRPIAATPPITRNSMGKSFMVFSFKAVSLSRKKA